MQVSSDDRICRCGVRESESIMDDSYTAFYMNFRDAESTSFFLNSCTEELRWYAAELSRLLGYKGSSHLLYPSLVDALKSLYEVPEHQFRVSA